MIEILKSKMMISFMILVIGVIYIDCASNKNLEKEIKEENLIVANS